MSAPTTPRRGARRDTRPARALEAPDAAPAAPYPRRWVALVVLCVALALVGMDNLIVNTALPTLAGRLGASTAQLQWVVDAYILVFAGTVLTMGSLGDRFGRRGALVTGLVVFAAASVASSFAGSADVLVATRALMGLGGALVCPATLSIITTVFPAHERPRAIGIWASFSVLGVVLGPTVGGLLLEHFWWGSVFLVNVPVALVLVVAVAAVVPDSRDPQATPLDPLGAALSVAGLAALVAAIIEVPVRGWTDPLTVVGFAVGLALLGVFVAWEVRSAHPMLPLGLFRDRRFSAANATLTLMFFAMNGTVFVLTQHLQGVLGYPPLRAGAAVLPVTALLLTAPTSGALARRLGSRAVVAAGMALQAAAVLLAAQVTVGSGYPRIALSLTLFGLGMGLAMAPATELVMSSLPSAKAGVGSALNDTTRSVGGALGVAVVGSVLAAGYRAGLGPALAGLPAGLADAARSSVEGAVVAAGHAGGAGGAALVGAARAAYVDGLQTALVVAAAVMGAGAVVAGLLMPRRPPRSGPGRARGRARRLRDAQLGLGERPDGDDHAGVHGGAPGRRAGERGLQLRLVDEHEVRAVADPDHGARP